MYYLRTRAAADAIKFTVDQQALAKNKAARTAKLAAASEVGKELKVRAQQVLRMLVITFACYNCVSRDCACLLAVAYCALQTWQVDDSVCCCSQLCVGGSAGRSRAQLSMAGSAHAAAGFRTMLPALSADTVLRVT